MVWVCKLVVEALEVSRLLMEYIRLVEVDLGERWGWVKYIELAVEGLGSRLVARVSVQHISEVQI